MKAPRSGTTKSERLWFWLDAQYKKPWVTYLVVPLLVGVPPWVIAKGLDSATVKTWLTSTMPAAAKIFYDYDLLFLGFASAYSWGLVAFGRFVAKKVQARSLDTSGLLALLASLDNVVGSKLKRFNRHVKECETLTEQTVFRHITQPRLQIAELCRGVFTLFAARRHPSSAALIRVVLAEVRAGKIHDLAIFFPEDEPPRAPLTMLNRSNSTFMTALRNRRIVVIESIGDELRKGAKASYVDTGVAQDASGSIICYPVITSANEVPFIISIHCDEEGYFKKASAEVYSVTLDRFALRINLEHSLDRLKEKLCGQ